MRKKGNVTDDAANVNCLSYFKNHIKSSLSHVHACMTHGGGGCNYAVLRTIRQSMQYENQTN